MSEEGIIYAIHPYKNNAHLIDAAARLGYLHEDWITLDPTYGLGNFWGEWAPKVLVKSDLQTTNNHWDFTHLPLHNGSIDAVVFDPPYKLNGTPTQGVDTRYGVQEPTRWQDRIELMKRGQKECARVLKPGGYLLTKCQDQVVSGRVVWQTDIMTNQAIHDGLTKVDRLDILTTPRPQPHARQVHARRNSSSLLVFRKLT